MRGLPVVQHANDRVDFHLDGVGHRMGNFRLVVAATFQFAAEVMGQLFNDL